jgi:hypothetical protein
MATFLNQERTKIGTTTGTLIAFPQELEVNDPNVGNSATLLPSGYLRCDGGVYSSTVYPALAEVLGTGSECSFKQEGQNLLDTQFQVPDLRSKFIRASSASDQGVINDNSVTNAAGQTVERSGVGVNVSSNVGSNAVVDMVGQFRVPPRTVTLTGNVGFTRPRRPDEEVVAITGFLPHMHYTTTLRCRTFRRQGSDVFELNYFNNASTVGAENWYDATDSGDPDGRQPACKHYGQSIVWNSGSYISGGGFLSASFEYYGICKGGCTGFINSCFVPTGKVASNDTTPEGECWQTFSVGFITVRQQFPCPETSYPVTANYVLGGTGVGLDDIPTASSGPSGVVQSFELYESWDNSVTYTGQDYYGKGLGQWAYTAYAANWTGLADFGSSEVDLSGGNGTGFRALVTAEAWPGAGGSATNTRYKILAIVDAGSGYQAGDVLTFPDIQGKNIGSAPSTGAGGMSLRVSTTAFGNAQDGAAYAHQQSLHDVMPVDTNVGNNNTVAYPQLSNIIETTEAFDYDSDPTQHTHTISYTTGLTNYKIDIPETFISTDGMSASISIQPETDTKIDNLISPFVMVDYLIKT